MLGLFKKTSVARGRIGLALGRDEGAIAIIRRDLGAPLLERCARFAFDPASGVGAAAAALRACGLPALPASTVLLPEDYQLALIEAPDVPPAELRAAMRWRLKDSIDFRVEDAVIDVFDVPDQNRGGHGRMMYAVAARRSAIERQAALLEGVARLDVIDAPELCLRNLAALLPGAGAGVALLTLGESTASIVLVRGKTFYFSRQMNLPTLPEGGDWARIDAASVVLELQRSLDYYERHFDQPPITRIAVAPAGPRGEDLAQNLGTETGFEVTTLDLNVLLHCTAPIAPTDQAACLLAVGAALREDHRSL